MRKKTLLITSCAVVIVLGVSLVILFRHLEDRRYEQRGGELIAKIEAFREQQHRLPTGISELGLVESMGEGPYYEMVDSMNYIVYFNIGFDDAKTYSSKTKAWTDVP